MNESSSLYGRTAIVTGASSGIGRAIAETLAYAGAETFLAGRTVSAMDQSKKRIEAAGGSAHAIQADVRNPVEVQSLVDSAVSETGRLDIMVNNAGLSYPAGILEGDPEQWRSMLETNVLGLLVGCQAAARAMRACGAEGHIVNISSIAAQSNSSGVYGATKHAVNTISASLRDELEEDSIRVVNVMPGTFATNIGRNYDPEFIAGLAKRVGLDLDVKRGERLPDEAFQRMAEGGMRQLLGDPSDIANAVLFAVTQPIHVNIADISVRPPKQIDL